MSRSSAQRVADIRHCCERILRYTSGMTQKTMAADELVTDGANGSSELPQGLPQPAHRLRPDRHVADQGELRQSHPAARRHRLDPFRIENTPTLYSAGNPDLRPAITQSLELGYEFHKKKTDLQATLFYRDKSDVFTTVQNDIGGNALLSTWANIGHVRDAGLELALNRDLLRHVTLNASADYRRSEVDAGNLGIGGARAAYIASGHATLNWQIGSNDFLQLGAQASGRELTAQGYYGGSIFTDLGWRRKLGSRLAMVVSAQDPFGLSRRTIATYTPTLVDVQKRKFNYSAAFISLSYALGGASKGPADNFDFGARQSGPTQ